jgi:subtilisin family serine protease
MESLVVLPGDVDADIASVVQKATNAAYIEIRDWKESPGARDKRDPRDTYAVIYPRLRVALTNAPREKLESAFGRDRVVDNFMLDLPLAPVDMQQTLIVSSGPCNFDETYETWARQVLQGAGNPDGHNVKVCVVDTGLQCDHPDFKTRPLDHDHIQPFNPTAVIDDEYGHGTYCAGIICGPPHPNKAPRYGIAPGIELFVANVFGKAFQTTVDSLIDALEWAIAKKCHIVSMSLYTLVQPDPAELARFREVFGRALDHGTILIACTGNSSDRTHGKVVNAAFPASLPEVLAVGGVTKCITMLNDSNSGGDVVAPGDYTWSADHSRFGYTHLEGTSVATAHAAGIAALHAQVSGKRGRDLLTLVTHKANTPPPPPYLDAGFVKPP